MGHLRVSYWFLAAEVLLLLVLLRGLVGLVRFVRNQFSGHDDR